MRGIDERPGLEHEDALVAAEALGEIVRQHAAADARADDDDVEVVPRADVLEEQPLLRGAASETKLA